MNNEEVDNLSKQSLLITPIPLIDFKKAIKTFETELLQIF